MTYPFVQARWFTPTNGRAIKWIVIHSMEAPESSNTAENVANYFKAGTVKASAHYCVDNNSVVQCVLDKDVAYAAPGANSTGLHIELAGYARQSRAEWLDAYSQPMLRLAAKLTADKLREFGIPIQSIAAAGLLAGLPGITRHVDVSNAFHLSTHTDPGVGFPMDVFLQFVREASGASPAPTPPPSGPIYGPITEDTVQPIIVKGIKLDNEGRGYYDVPVNKEKVVSILLNGADPTSSGYKPIVEFAALGFAGITRVVMEGGIPGGAIDFTVWVTK